jgi:hypothetical protein
MTVKELINELLEYPMDSDVMIQIKLADMDLEYGNIEVETVKTGGGWGIEHPYLSIDLEHKTSQQYVDGIGEE